MRRLLHIVPAVVLLVSAEIAEGQNNSWFKFKFQDEDPSGTIFPALQNQVHSKYGSDFEVYFAAFDSAIGNTPVWNFQGAITDPYVTLKGCVFFWVAPTERNFEDRDSLAIGFSRNGQIIWSSPPIYKGGMSQIYLSRDLNKDGEVDLVVLGTPSYTYSQADEIYVFSWNGTRCRLISQVDAENESDLFTSRGPEVIDPDGDGVFDLRAYWPDSEDMRQWFPDDPIPTRPWVTYSWDGTKYTLAPPARQIPGDVFLPANRLKVTARCQVTATNDLYKYSYVFSNDLKSEQRARLIVIGGHSDSTSMYAPDNWITGAAQPEPAGRAYVGMPGYEQSMIGPGESKAGFGYLSGALPGIVRYYVQGDRPPAYTLPGSSIDKEQYEDDLIRNSFSSSTLGALTPPNSITVFLDTLLSYIRQSADLGWLGRDRDNDCDNDERPDDGVVKNIEKRLEKAKRFLERDDSVKARKELEKLVQKVERIWKRSQDQEKKRGRDREWKQDKSLMTSEAYALLKYNTEYLIDRLPEREKPEKGRDKDKPNKKDRE